MGSNLGNRPENLNLAIQLISITVGKISKISTVYETAAWGKENQPAFLNQVIRVATNIEASDLLKELLTIEKKVGRIRTERWGERIIDIDILFFNHSVIDSTELQVPHPEIPNRRFTLVPLAEIAPDYTHPILKKTTTILLSECPDMLQVSPYSG